MPKPKKIIDDSHANSAPVVMPEQQRDIFDSVKTGRVGRPKKEITRRSVTKQISANIDQTVYDAILKISLEQSLKEGRKVSVSEVINDILKINT